MKQIAQATIRPGIVELNGQTLFHGDLNEAYRQLVGDYPKFFKMDGLCKLGFLGAELLLKDFPAQEKEHGAIIIFTRAGSLATDRAYQATIASAENYFPSPALFVYTLANIATGEIAIRHKIYGETSCYILGSHDPATIDETVEECLSTSRPSFILAGWLDYENCEKYVANLKLLSK